MRWGCIWQPAHHLQDLHILLTASRYWMHWIDTYSEALIAFSSPFRNVSAIVFHKLDEIGNNAKIGICGLTIDVITLNSSNKNVTLKWVLNPWTSDSKSNTLLCELIWHVLLRRSLNFCSCTTWFLDLVRIDRTWLYKETKVSVLQAIYAKLVRKGERWRFRGSILTGVAFC